MRAADGMWIGLFDFHYGTESGGPARPGPKKKIHNERFFSAVLEMATKEKADTWIWGGDNLNCGPVNHHERFNPLLLEGERMGRDLRGFRQDILGPVNALKLRRKIWLYGNHERWLWDFATANPGVSDMLDPDEWLGLRGDHWEIYYKGGLANVGNCYFVHGDVALKTGSRGHAAKKLVDEYKMSVRCGHLHTDQFYTSHRAIIKKDRDMHTGRIVPCACDLDPAYSAGKPHNWVNGFNVGYYLADGSFWDQTVLWIENKFVFNGRVYKG